MTTTTTSTTTLPPRATALEKVETVLVTASSESASNDASGTKGTLQTINSDALSFGSLAPGETSETKIIYLRVPYSQAINNIKIALINAGNITFTTSTFGIEIRNYLDYNLGIENYFQGINIDNSPDNVNNISVSNHDNVSSQYVYLNIKLPLGQSISGNVVRLKWFFDYA